MLDVDLGPADGLGGRRPIRSILFDSRLMVKVVASRETSNRSAYQTLECEVTLGKQIASVAFSEFRQIHKRRNGIQMIVQGALATAHLQRQRAFRSNLPDAIPIGCDRPIEHRPVVRCDRDCAYLNARPVEMVVL